MAWTVGNALKITLFGESHATGLGVSIDGFPAGVSIDMERINALLAERTGAKETFETSRNEKDTPVILSGILNGVTTGAPISAVFYNEDVDSATYEERHDVFRPSHADYTAQMKYHGFNDVRGGGMFSGRLTLPLTFAGALCLSYLENKNIKVNAYVSRIGDILASSLEDEDAFGKMKEYLKQVSSEKDSVGGWISVSVDNMPIGVGEPFFDSIESTLARLMFSVPAVKGVEFGMGFEGVTHLGSEVNDAFSIDETGKVSTKTNYSGGILGGISNGMPIEFKVGVKPTPSIGKEQDSVSLSHKENVKLTILGRHDSCIVFRVLPVVKAMTAIGLMDLMLQGNNGFEG